MTDEDLKEMIAQLAVSQAETAQQQRETDRRQRETDRMLRENAKLQRDTDRQLRATDRQVEKMSKKLEEVGKQLGGLGDKFGSFTEGMALPSMTRVLEERFGLDNIAPRYRIRKNGKTLEIDVFGFSNTNRNVAVAVEIKSHLREEGLQQILEILRQIPEMMPQHRDKKLYGILAVVDAPEELRKRVLAEGIYLAHLAGDTFELQVPEDFEPRSFQ